MENNNTRKCNSTKGSALKEIKGFTASTHSSDTALFKTLGLEVFSEIPSNIERFVGEVNFKNGSKAKIWVRPMPAQFWKIEMFLSEYKRVVVITTGSGALSTFWNTIKLIADGMLDIAYKKQ
jgi:hypothetical protein